jgi:hypothetical protein
MKNGVLWLSLVLAAVSIAVIGLPGQAKIAEASSGDVCSVTTFDSTGRILNDGDTVGGDGTVYLVYRIEDDAFGYFGDYLDGPVQDLIDPLHEQIDDLNGQLADLVSSSDWTDLDLPDYDEDTTSDQIQDDIDDVRSDPDFTNSASPDYDDLQASSTLLDEAYQIVIQKEAAEEVLLELENALNGFKDYDEVVIDSETGSADITSQAEVTHFEWVKPAVAHILVQPPTLSQKVDHMFPTWFADPDGNDLDNINSWLSQVAGAPPVVNDAANVCGTAMDDGWGFVDIKCTDPGLFNINVIPHRPWLNSEMLHGIRALNCPGAANTATIVATPLSVETQPVGTNTDTSLVIVTTYDAAGDNIDGAEVRFLTNNCVFIDPLAGGATNSGISPAGGGTVVTTYSDTDSNFDDAFLANNPEQTQAGSAEVFLNCALGTPGTASITAIVPRDGADVELKIAINVVGPTATDGLKLTLTPTSLVCGETLLATVSAVDVNGKPVSDGTLIHFTTDTSTAIIGGLEGAQGQNTTIGGSTTVSVAMSPNDPGTHSVIAWTEDKAGKPLAQTTQTFECTEQAVAGAASDPGSTTTNMVEGINSITPPNTGDAGLADAGTGSSHFGLIAVAGAAVVALGLLGVRKLAMQEKQR